MALSAIATRRSNQIEDPELGVEIGGDGCIPVQELSSLGVVSLSLSILMELELFEFEIYKWELGTVQQQQES